MRKTITVVASLAALASLAFVVRLAVAGEEKEDDKAPKPKYTIETIMKDAHKGGLLKKVVSGKATKEEKLHLLDMYISLYENKPEKGELESWTKKTGDVLAACAKLVVDPEADPKSLEAAANCKGCHELHK